MKKGCFAGWLFCCQPIYRTSQVAFFLLLLPSSSMLSHLLPCTQHCRTGRLLHCAQKYLQRCQDGAWEQPALRRETATGAAVLCSAPLGRKGDCVQRGRQQVLWHFWDEWRTCHYFLLPRAGGIKKRTALVTLGTVTELSTWRTQTFKRITYNSHQTIPALQPNIDLFIEEWALPTLLFISMFQ